MKFYERKYNRGMSNEETVNAVDLDSLLDNLGKVSVDNVKIAGIQVYFMGSEEGIYELFLEKSNNCVRRTEKFENHSGCGDELFDSLRQAQDVYCGSSYERRVKLFALLVKEIEKASAYKSGISAWDSDAQIRAFVGYENDGEMKYLTTANAVITPIMLAVLKDFEHNGRGYDEYWRIWQLADLTDTSDLEERIVELKYELDWNDDDEYEDDEWDDEEFEDEEDE
jgi:hypothetical protein